MENNVISFVEWKKKKNSGKNTEESISYNLADIEAVRMLEEHKASVHQEPFQEKDLLNDEFTRAIQGDCLEFFPSDDEYTKTKNSDGFLNNSVVVTEQDVYSLTKHVEMESNFLRAELEELLERNSILEENLSKVEQRLKQIETQLKGEVNVLDKN